MCVAIYKPAGAKIPSREDLEAAYNKNPHGAGIAVPSQDRKGIQIHKGYFSFEKWFKAIQKHVKKDRPAILHARIATHGKVAPGTCHPFPICEDFEQMKKAHHSKYKGACLAHNGMLQCGNGGKKSVSDTMTFSKLLAETDLHTKAKSSKAGPWNQSIDMMTKGNKVAIMWPEGTVRLYGNWTKVAGVYWSNLRWQIFLDFDEEEEEEEKEISPKKQTRPVKRRRNYLTTDARSRMARTNVCPTCKSRVIRSTDGMYNCTFCGLTG